MTTIGSQNPGAYQQYDWDRYHPRIVHVHVYLDKGVSEKRARELMAQWKGEDAGLYGIDLEPTGFDPMPRDFGMFHNSLLDQVDAIPLRGNDDRVFYFVNQRARDYIYSYMGIFPLGLIPPEVLGEVDDPTMTHGWVWAHAESLPSFILPPDYTTWHELYHLIGSCPHGDDMGAPGGCYDHIHTLKTTPTTNEFFASMSADGNHLYRSRAEVNARLAGWRDPLWPFATSHEPKNLPSTPLPPVPAEQQVSNQRLHDLERD
jgi:hypothetical protein